MTAEDIERCNLMVKDFIDTNEHKTLVLPDRLMINQCFYYFKSLYKNLEKKKGGPSVAGIQGSKPKAIEDDDNKRERTENSKANGQSNAQQD